jgi:hypothetical protein
MGNLRGYDYDFNGLWNSERANQIRQGVKHCSEKCPMANANYTNSLLHVPTMMNVVKGLL